MFQTVRSPGRPTRRSCLHFIRRQEQLHRTREEKNGTGSRHITPDKTSGAKAPAAGTSAQRAELVALTRPLALSKGNRVNIYMDSKCAFLTLHAHGTVWREQAVNSQQKEREKAARNLGLVTRRSQPCPSGGKTLPWIAKTENRYSKRKWDCRQN